MKKCRYCKSEMDKKAKICPMCGKKQKSYKWCFVLMVLILCIGATVSVNSNGTPKEVREPQSLLAETMELTQQQEQDMLTIFDACGVGEIISIQTIQNGESYTSYWLDDAETSAYKNSDFRVVVYVSNDTKELRDIYFHNQDIYTDRQVISQVTDYYVPSELRDEYRLTAQLMVQECLNYPDTAKFGSISKWAFARNDDGHDVVQSSVSAKNAFGMESAENFQVTFDRATGVPVSLILDGTEYIK